MATRTQVEISGHTFHLKAFPATVCLDNFADLQARLLGSLFVQFGAGDGTGKMTSSQKLEGIITGIVSTSSNMTGETAKFIRKRAIDPEYTYIFPENEKDPVKLTSEVMEKEGIDAGVLLKLVVKALIFQYEPLFTSALDLFGLEAISRKTVESWLERFKTEQKDTVQSGDSSLPTN